MDREPVTNPDAREPAGGAVGVLLAVSRLLTTTAEDPAPAEVHASILREARAVFSSTSVVLLGQAPGRTLEVLDGDAPERARRRPVPLDDHPAIAELLDKRVRVLRLEGEEAAGLEPIVGEAPEQLLLLLLRAVDGFADAVLVATGAPRVSRLELVSAFADAAAAALDRLRAREEHERVTAQQEALTRAAKTLNGSLDLDTVLARICREAAEILRSSTATVFRGTVEDGLTVAATHGLPPEAVGYRMAPGAGLAGKVLLRGQAMLTNDYGRIADLPPDAPFTETRSAMAAPMVWDGEQRGVLSVGYRTGRSVTHQDLSVLETFAELAATACANAAAHEGLAQVARTDGLTGCLNHAAMQDSLRREIERATRAGAAPLSLVLVDLDHFKQVNEAYGHLAGDEVLRRAGHALRHATRPYDLAARYGGDEFALIAVEADEDAATEIGRRALARIDDAIREFLPPGGTPGTVGVAQWGPGVTATELISRADRALMFAKQEGARGQVIPFSEVADHFRPGRFARTDRSAADEPAGIAPERDWPGQRLDERLRKRTRQLALATALGARLAAMTDADEIVEATADELHRAFGYGRVTITRNGLTVERGDDLEGQLAGGPARSELTAAIWAGDEPWGTITIADDAEGAYDEEDDALLRTVAAQAGGALRAAQQYARLEGAYLGTAEALASAIEGRDTYADDHPRAIGRRAEAVGRLLGLDARELRDLRFAAVFHDIGKLSIPQAILHKPGPLDGRERAVVEQHTVAGERILAGVEDLEGARRLVRHEHERYDGGGYPDGLAGEDIPLGSRIILACDALHAMTNDRPYRPAMTLARAIEELRRNASTQFDPVVIAALLEVLERDDVLV